MRWLYRFSVFVLAVIVSACGGGGGDGGGSGTTPSRFMVVGDYETRYSTDGTNWVNLNNSMFYPVILYGVTYGNGTFVAVGGGDVDGYARIVRSTDNGSTWSLITPTGSLGTLWDVAYGNGKFVAVGNLGSALISTDGNTWTAAVVPQAKALSSITFGNGYFVAVGLSDSASLYNDAWYSTDGSTWATKAGINATGSLSGVAFGNGRYVAVGSTTPTAWYSGNRTSWTSVTMGAGTGPRAIAYGNGRFVAVGGTNTWWSNTDGTSWNYVSVVSNNLMNVAYGNGRFVAVGLLAQVMTSTDGTQWTNSSPPAGGRGFYGIGYGP